MLQSNVVQPKTKCYTLMGYPPILNKYSDDELGVSAIKDVGIETGVKIHGAESRKSRF